MREILLTEISESHLLARVKNQKSDFLPAETSERLASSFSPSAPSPIRHSSVNLS